MRTGSVTSFFHR